MNWKAKNIFFRKNRVEIRIPESERERKVKVPQTGHRTKERERTERAKDGQKWGL